MNSSKPKIDHLNLDQLNNSNKNSPNVSPRQHLMASFEEEKAKWSYIEEEDEEIKQAFASFK